jgi:hypothetical protein
VGRGGGEGAESGAIVVSLCQGRASNGLLNHNARLNSARLSQSDCVKSHSGHDVQPVAVVVQAPLHPLSDNGVVVTIEKYNIQRLALPGKQDPE